MRVPCRRLIPALALAMFSALAACARGASASGAPAHRTRLSSTVLTEAEIMRAGADDAYETIARLRPLYLSLMRTRTGSCERAVVVDGMRMGGLGELRRIRAENVREIRSLNAADATTLFGIGHCAGAIAVVTRVAR
jgi:hypothetical protein